MSSTCSSCKFWTRQRSPSSGQCRCMPPSLREGKSWPVTKASDWCGQFTPALQENIGKNKQLLKG